VVQPGLKWHPALYVGSARYYATGRVGYPAALAEALAQQLGLDGSGRLLDVGCGPGSLTLLLAPWFEQATGVDADRDMLAEARRLAVQSGVVNVEWLQLALRNYQPAWASTW
jgi:cyclopropane fatty-acyl-phospholipid synthase-like methyltransferase